MELHLAKIDIDSLAQLLDTKPQKFRAKLEKIGEDLGFAVPDEGWLELYLVELCLDVLGYKWLEITNHLVVVPDVSEVSKASCRPHLFLDLAELELNPPHCHLDSIDFDWLYRFTSFLDDHALYENSVQLWAAAYGTAIQGSIVEPKHTAEFKLNYAISRVKELLQAGKCSHAAEMAYSALGCKTEIDALGNFDEITALYLLAILSAEGIVNYHDSLEDNAKRLIEIGLESGQTKAIDRLRQGIRRGLFLYRNFVELIDLPRTSKVSLRKQMDRVADRNLTEADRSIDFYGVLADDISKHIQDFKKTCEGLLASQGYAGIDQCRNRLIRSVSTIQEFATPEEKQVLDSFRDFVSNKLTDWKHGLQSGNAREFGRIHNETCALAESLSQQISDSPSWLTSCFVLPVICTVSQQLRADFDRNTSSYLASVVVELTKKEYPLKIEATQIVNFFVRNDGNSSAEGVEVELISTSDLSFSATHFNFGDLEIGSQSSETSVTAEPLNERAVYEVPYRLKWTNITGMSTSTNDFLRLLPQRQINWDAYRFSNPYSIASIKENEPEKLKGRNDTLSALRLGLHSMQSYFITGQKRVGKSSVANVFYGELCKQPNTLAVHFPWGDVADCDLAMLGQSMCEFVAESWRDRTDTALPFEIPSLNDFRQSFSRTLSDYLRTFNRRLREWKLVFIIDDFDEIREELYKGETGDAFFTTLRAFIDRDFTSFIVVGSERLSATILREQGQKVNQADVIEVDYLTSRTDLVELIIEPSKDVLYFDPAAINQIIELTAGNPYYINLLCSRIYRLMLTERDYYVSIAEVRKATTLLANEDKEKSYSHFWTDGIHDNGPERDRIEYNNAMTLIALSKGQSDICGFADIQTIAQQPEVKHMETAELEYRLNELSDRKVIERSRTGLTGYRIKVQLFASWLQTTGAFQIKQSFGQYEYSIRPLRQYALFPEEIVQLADGLQYRGIHKDRILVETWLRQFGDEYNQRLAYKVLSAAKERGYYSIDRFNSCLEQMFKVAVASVQGWYKVVDPKIKKKIVRNVLVTHVGVLGKSGPQIVTEFRRVNDIFYGNCGTIEQIVQRLSQDSSWQPDFASGERWLLLIVDDFIGSGNSGAINLNSALEELDNGYPTWQEKCHAIYTTVCGFRKGAELIETATNERVRVIIANDLEEQDRAFAAEANIFQDDKERRYAKTLFQKIGSSLEKKHPLGHEDSQALIIFPNNVPNNTLPVLYKEGTYEGKLWTPLFSRV